jgi:hypothetical protein
VARTEQRLTWLDVPAEEDVAGEVKELWAAPLQRLGFVPNVLRVFALRPDHLLRWWSRDVQLHEPARVGPRLAAEPRVLHARTLTRRPI